MVSRGREAEQYERPTFVWVVVSVVVMVVVVTVMMARVSEHTEQRMSCLGHVNKRAAVNKD